MPVHAYPTRFHAGAAEAIEGVFAARDETGTVLLVIYSARGRSTTSGRFVTAMAAGGMIQHQRTSGNGRRQGRRHRRATGTGCD